MRILYMDDLEINDVILYPEHRDPEFKEKIARKKEFIQHKFITHIPEKKRMKQVMGYQNNKWMI